MSIRVPSRNADASRRMRVIADPGGEVVQAASGQRK
jgi:hypothetical protein